MPTPYRRVSVSRRERWYYALLITIVLMAIVWMPRAEASGNSRSWHIAYNPGLGAHSAAAPASYRVGDRLRITYGGKSWRVLVVDTGPYFDISTAGMNHLASTSKGVIVARVSTL